MDGILYERTLPHGPSVRIRRVTIAGESPVTLVLEVDRRAGTPRAGEGHPPTLMQVVGATEQDGVRALEPHARDDRRVVQLMRDMGLR
jgi:hypothetical protein